MNDLTHLIVNILTAYASYKFFDEVSDLYFENKFYNKKIEAIDAEFSKRKNFNIDYDKIGTNIKGLLVDEVCNFADVITKNIPDEYLNNFYNNIDTLVIKYKKLLLPDLIDFSETAGYYDIKKNEIKLSKKYDTYSINHELFHMSSAYKKFCGFHQVRNWKNVGYNVGYGVNEGYTELLTRKYFRDSKDRIGSYPYEVSISINVEFIVGHEKMIAFYLTNDLKSLIQELSNYIEYEEVISFINKFDFINKYIYKPKKSSYLKKLIDQSMMEINRFLINAYANKLGLNKDLDINKLSDEIKVFMAGMSINLILQNNENAKLTYSLGEQTSEELYDSFNKLKEELNKEEEKNKKKILKFGV